MKIFYQPGGEKGIIRWSLLLMLFMLGIITQLEIFKSNYIAPIIMIIASIIIIWFILKSYLVADNEKLIIYSPLKKQIRTINISELSSIRSGKYYLVLNFKSAEFFPIRIIAFPKSIKKLSSLINK
ncbi:hypothetical protein RD055328_06160 [Companilactobacillus sp. RD055328]|uniref:EbsA family protein n=1 Tax=Companilactobacillus sp. RD055328 TaxID=2916634 RepID=UPI001FC85717|nr:EbsA family protein [Companilactobacillus sp. RD055328]GKQ42693.1 hypothetical protein RD055328_06160 [Companilactobacillus sp. RD055328]